MERLRKRSRPIEKRDDKEVSEDVSPAAHKCQVCDKVYSRADTLQNHFDAVHGKRSFKCSTCPKVFSSNGALQRHGLTHNSERVHQCEHCHTTFKRVDELTYHMCNVHGRKLVVPRKREDADKAEIIGTQCGYCVEKKALRHHLISVMHKGKAYTRHQCTICLKVHANCDLNWHHDNVIHEKTDVPIQKGYQCRNCIRLFASHKLLHQHGRNTCFPVESSEPLYKPSRDIEHEREAWRNGFIEKRPTC